MTTPRNNARESRPMVPLLHSLSKGRAARPGDLIESSCRWGLRAVRLLRAMFIPLRPRAALLAASLATLLASCTPDASAPASTAGANPSGTPPNIVIALADDLGYGDVGFMGSEIRTPQLDALAAESLVLEHYYASAACTTSRTQLLTGQLASRIGLDNNVNFKDSHGLAAGIPTLPGLLQARGYRTHLVGKWHLGHRSPEHHPLRHGFDHFYGLLTGWIEYDTHRHGGESDWYRDDKPLQEEGYATTLLTAEAVRVIGESANDERPLFLLLAYNAPHFPLHTAPGKTLGTNGTLERRQFRTMVEALDDGIGEVRAAIDASPESANTIFLFASDNGGVPGQGGNNGSLHGQKFSMYEGGIRVPAFVHWPAQIPARRSGQVITNLDLLPTLCAAAGIARADLPPLLDGDNVLPFFTGDEPMQRAPLFFALSHRQSWKSALLRGQTKIVHTVDPEGAVHVEVFDLANDTSETRDLSSDRPDETRELQELVEERARECAFGAGE